MLADQASAGLVEEIVAGDADFPVSAGDLGPGLGAVRGPLLAAGQAPLAADHAPRPAVQVPGVGDPLAAAGDREVRDPQVNARRSGPGWCGQTRPGPGTSTANETYQRPHGSRDTVTVDGSIVAGSISGQDQVNASGVSIFARNRRAVTLPEPGPGVLRGLLAMPGLEPRIPGALSEERRVRGLLVADRRPATVPRNLIRLNLGHVSVTRRKEERRLSPQPEDRGPHAAKTMNDQAGTAGRESEAGDG